MAETMYDAVVVGGGPAGSSAAAFLSSKGRKVLLLEKEKWPKDKTCGDAISGKSIKIIEELGLIGELERADHALVEGVTFSSPSGKVASITFASQEKGIKKGYVCRRQVFDHIVWKAAAKAAEARDGAEVVGVLRENGKVCGVRAKIGGREEEFRGKIIIGADGVSSLVAREIRGSEVDPAHTCIAYRAYYSGISGMGNALEIHFVRSIMPGYFWIFPLENGLANVGVGMVMEDMKARNVNLQKAMLEVIEKNPLFAERFKSAKQLTPIKAWSLPFGSKRRKVHSDGVLLVGDAAGLVDPFSGEGIGNALLSGKIAAQVADEALAAGDTSESFLARYPERLWKEVGDELERSYMMQKLGRHEWLLNFVIAKASSSQKAREAIASTFSDEEARKGYASPLFYLRLLLS
ncbi:MAG: NAD(P)/FAD-dependent oxidoreductase [Candidatus Micrarchaeota archaeon]|nr:NAD(P)/FAD-dependent oxidoreductase [Candidatus Micrarchaeota archaeon]